MVEQGDLIKVEGIEWPCVVVSKNTYNQSGHAIVCPITNQENATLGYRLSGNSVSGYVQCDNIRMIDLKRRSFSVKGRLSMIDLIQVISRVNSLFDLI